GGIPGWLWVLLAAAVAFFVFRKLGSKKKLAANNPYAPNNGGQKPLGRSAAPTNTGVNTNIFGQSVGGGAAEVMVSGEKSYLIRERETVESLWEKERLLPEE
ncbi:hypothetical protein ACFMKD_21120, partial [Acinetobacter baumannii]